MKKTISIAESCTGGLVSHIITNTPGSSDYFKMGIIAYSNETKIKILKIPFKIIKTYGAVSKQTACLMAKNVRLAAKSDIGLGITGIAGPSGGTKKKPVGIVYIAVSTKEKTTCKKFNFTGARETIKNKAAKEAVKIAKLS